MAQLHKPFRVLHIFGCLSKGSVITGGAEKWVFDLLQLLNEKKSCGQQFCEQKYSEQQYSRDLQFDFLLSIDSPPLTEKIRQTGSKIHFVPFSRSPFPWSCVNQYLYSVRKILRNEHYDAVHCHQFDLSGEILRIAAQENVPKRVMSVHATEYETNRFYRSWVHHLWGHPYICRYATDILPCSKAVDKYFVSDNRKLQNNCSAKKQILYTGINTANFRFTEEELKQRSVLLRQEFNIPEDAVIIGHTGRFTRQKNHWFLIELLAEMCRSDKRIYAVLAGEGEFLQPLRQLIEQLGLTERIILPGARTDIPVMMSALFDVFVLPSLYEGLPISVCEALCGGLNVVMSDAVSDELNDWFPDRICQLPLNADIAVWKDTVAAMLRSKVPLSEALRSYEETPFTIEKSLEHLTAVYSVSGRDSVSA
jgi:glycosyltransferase involved in cell wall biosynthesis